MIPQDGDELLGHDLEEMVGSLEGVTLPRQLAEDLPEIALWEPPAVDLAIELEHLVGGARDVIASHREITAAQLVQRQIRRLPRRLRGLIQSVRTPWHQEELLQLVEREVMRRAGIATVKKLVVPGQPFTDSYLPEIHRRAALVALANDAAFLKSLEKEARQVKSEGHLIRLFGGPPRDLPTLPPCSMPVQGTWRAEGWLGLAASSMPEALPEEVVVALAQDILRRHPATRRRGRTRLNLLHWGALNGLLALALTALAPKRRDVHVTEIDTLGQQLGLPCVVERTTLLPRARRFDLGVVHLPPAGVDANHIRNRYKNLAQPGGNEHRLQDLGRLGPRKWRSRVSQLLPTVLDRMVDGSRVALIVPTSVRTATRRGKYAEWGYRAQPELAHGIRELLGQLGWHLSHDLEIVEMNPLPQPFFLTRRCSWRLMLASQSVTSPHADTTSVEDVFL